MKRPGSDERNQSVPRWFFNQPAAVIFPDNLFCGQIGIVGNVYINGMIGYFTDGDVQVNIFARSETDKTWGIGGGAGFEYFFSKLPRFGWSLEVDFVYIDFEKKWWKYDYHAWSLLMLGMGVHYYF
jgi:hypothetical protein